MTPNKDFRIAPPAHLLCERVGDEVLVLDTSRHTTHHLQGPWAEAYLAAANGDHLEPFAREVADLQAAGLLTLPPGISRRHVVTAAGATATAALVALSMPTVAEAQSHVVAPEPEPELVAFDPAAGEWEWRRIMTGGETTGFTVTQTGNDEGLPTDGFFEAGQVWTLTLVNFGDLTAAATIEGNNVYLFAIFSFPGLDGDTVPDPAFVLQARLSKSTDEVNVVTNTFAINPQ